MSAFHSNMLLGSVKTADLGDPIEQSLRFSGSQYLQGPNFSQALGTNTLSMWVKKSANGVANGVFGTSGAGYGVHFNSSDKLVSNTSQTAQSTGVYRDPSAWYHLVFNGNDSVFVNGVEDPTFTHDNNLFSTSSSVGLIIGATYPNTQQFNGYIAEVYFVDGQSLAPTEFGRYNDKGVWVPITPTISSYGADGFHLTFDPTQTNGVGHDSSGQGNHFTATGFTTTAGFNDDVVDDTPTNNYATLNAVLSANNQTLSNGNLTGAGTGVPASDDISLTTQVPDYPYYWESTGSNYYYGIAHVDTDRDNYLGSKSDQVGWFNNGSFWVSATSQGTLGPSFTTTDVVMQAYDPATGKYWVGKNGTWYGSGNPATGANPAYTVSTALREKMIPASNVSAGTSTHNYGQQTFSYTVPSGFKVLATDNLSEPAIKDGSEHFRAITGPGQGSVTSAVTGVQSTNQVETHFTSNATLTPQNGTDLIGVRVYMSGGSGAGGSASYTEGLGGAGAVYGDDGDDTQWRTQFLSKTELNGSGAFTAGAGGTINSSNSFGGGAGQLSQFVTNGGGITLTAAGSDGGDGRYHPPGTAVYTSPGGTAAAGSMSVIDTTYTAIAGGAGAASRNMPGQTNGSPGNTGQMYALELYPTSSGIGVSSTVVAVTFGDATGLSDITAGNIVENLTGTAAGIVVDIDGLTMYVEQTSGQFSTGDQLLTLSGPGSGLLGLAQQIFPSGLWWIKDRANSNQHQLVDSVNGSTAVFNSPAGTSNNTYSPPTGNSAAWFWNAADTKGGFSITNGTHGLGITPAMVIDRAGNVWHQSLTAGQGLVLTSSAASAAQTWTVNATTVAGPGGGTYYTWSEIPGYSAFGSFTGNSSTDGPCVYLDFRPAFVLVKCVNTTGYWYIWDSTRDKFNENSATVLYPNLVNAESKSTTYALDLLSNGFKVRTSYSHINYTTYSYIYAAFAENPFGGENTAPATAR